MKKKGANKNNSGHETRKHTQWCTTTEHMHIRNRLFFFLFHVCIFCYLVIRGCFHVLELSDLFIKKCYFPVLLLHHLQKSEIVMWWLLINTSRLSPLSQPCGGLLTVHWLRQRRNVLAAAVSFAWQNDVQKKTKNVQTKISNIEQKSYCKKSIWTKGFL